MVWPPGSDARANAEVLAPMLDCVRPLIFESGVPEFPLYAGGSCFLSRYKSKLIVFTAQHCAKPNDLAPGNALVLRTDRTPVPLRQELHVDRFSNGDANDNAWTDISCFTVYDDALKDELLPYEYIDLDDLSSRHLDCGIGQPLLIAGYRSSCDPPHIRQELGIEFGTYHGPSESRSCHLFQRMIAQNADPNGFSGSPVFSFRFNETRLDGLNLLGMVVQSADNHPEIRFVGIDVIMRFARKITSVEKTS